jgi:ornithine cyclodeaminase/alanine dehydrogenase-like protein (mu-crystallin family)
MRQFTEAEVRKALPWDPLIEAMERAPADYSRGNVVLPVRSTVTVEGGRRSFGMMPAVRGDVMGAKLVSFFPGNEGTGIALSMKG